MTLTPWSSKSHFSDMFTMFQNSQKIGAWSGDGGMDSWCTTNCNHPIPYCPPTQVMVTMRILMLVKCQMKKKQHSNEDHPTSVLATKPQPPWLQLPLHHLEVLHLPPLVHQGGAAASQLESATHCKDSSLPSLTFFSSSSPSSSGQTLLQAWGEYCIGCWTSTSLTIGKYWKSNIKLGLR